MSTYSVIGKRVHRVDGPEKVTGSAKYTFDMVLPLDYVGFMAKISKALAECGISIFVISAYSTDHILVKEEDLSSALAALGKLGFEVHP